MFTNQNQNNSNQKDDLKQNSNQEKDKDQGQDFYSQNQYNWDVVGNDLDLGDVSNLKSSDPTQTPSSISDGFNSDDNQENEDQKTKEISDIPKEDPSTVNLQSDISNFPSIKSEIEDDQSASTPIQHDEDNSQSKGVHGYVFESDKNGGDLLELTEEGIINADKAKEEEKENVFINKSKYDLCKKIIANIEESLGSLKQLFPDLSNQAGEEIAPHVPIDSCDYKYGFDVNGERCSKIVEGVFNGESMIGPDGKEYSVPANYASKSKLLEGDGMKLTIEPNGTFLYKQIQPIERRRVVGTLEQTKEGNFVVISDDNQKWRVLKASITYYKGDIGDKVTIFIPKLGKSKWAAVDNITKG